MNDLNQDPIIPVVVIEDAEATQPLAEALLAGGLNIIDAFSHGSAKSDH